MSASKRQKESPPQGAIKTLIMGAAGFDYHCFNMVFRNDPGHNVVAFSFCEEQNLGTDEGGESARKYPPDLAGPLYPNGIPFIPEKNLADFVKKNEVKLVVFAYSDISHEELMHRASIALATGADFKLVSPSRHQIKSTKPVLSICAVRTGVGKSSVARAAVRFFQNRGKRVVGVREPMPYGDLSRQTVMRFATYEDLALSKCTIEEREEYEPYVSQNMIIYSGVDYEKVLRKAEEESDVIIWDGGNNEVSFFESDLLCVLADPLRPGHEKRYHPGECNCRLADCFIVAKCHEASETAITSVEQTLRTLQPDAEIVRVASVTRLENPADEALLKGKTVIVVDDGPTLTHGNAAFGAGFVMARKLGLQIVDPRTHASGSYKKIFHEFPHLESCVPAMGYTDEQIQDLADTLNRSSAEIVINGSPSDLKQLLGDKLKKPVYRVLYDVGPIGGSKKTLEQVFEEFAKKHGL